MITEDYVSFEVAKLLKEKGFDEQCTYMYNSQHKLYSTFEQCRQITRNNSDWTHCVGKLNIVPIAVPTHQMALKYLRKTYKVHFEVLYRANRYEVFIMTIEELPKCICRGITGKTNEEAVDKALKYYLTNQI